MGGATRAAWTLFGGNGGARPEHLLVRRAWLSLQEQHAHLSTTRRGHHYYNHGSKSLRDVGCGLGGELQAIRLRPGPCKEQGGGTSYAAPLWGRPYGNDQYRKRWPTANQPWVSTPLSTLRDRALRPTSTTSPAAATAVSAVAGYDLVDWVQAPPQRPEPDRRSTRVGLDRANTKSNFRVPNAAR